MDSFRSLHQVHVVALCNIPPDISALFQKSPKAHTQNTSDIRLKMTDTNVPHHNDHPPGATTPPVTPLDDGYYVQVQSAPYRRLEHPADRSFLLACIGALTFFICALIFLVPAAVVVFVFLPIGLIIRNCMACCCCCNPNKTCSCCCVHFMSHSDTVSVKQP